jgi:iron complex transport system ATP-binding protein
MLEACDCSYLQHGLPLLQQVSLRAAVGELTVIIGPNGAGKSTLLSLLSGSCAASSGHIRINQHDPRTTPARQLSRMRAVVEQQPGWQPGMTAAELVMMGAYQTRGALADWRAAMQQTECEQLATRRIETLSGGERQRVHLARALLQILSSSETERFLLLDEPTAALDFGLADNLMARIHRWSRDYLIGVVAVVHDLNLTLRHADQVLLMADGRGAAFGPSAEVMQKHNLEKIYGVHLAELVSQDQLYRAFIPMANREWGV